QYDVQRAADSLLSVASGWHADDTSVYLSFITSDQPQRYLHSFPTRRSSDLLSDMARFVTVRQGEPLGNGHAVLVAKDVVGDEPRSEEHTSELQSLRHLVCCLLLEKKYQERDQYKKTNVPMACKCFLCS